jgi:hypothetical protein
VSYVADPNTGVGVAYGRYLYEVGGTSAGAPQWAALIALANSVRTSGAVRGNADIYLVAGTAPIINANFFDITSGSNGSDTDDLSGPGYDLVTGLGSPVANNLVPALAPQNPDFTVSVAPGSQTVSQGGTATYIVTVGSLAGFTQDVTLSVSGLPAGANGSFIQNPVPNGSGSSDLTVTTSGTTTAGTYTITITGTSTGTSGPLTHTATVTLVVAPPDFTISASPTSSTVKRGGSTTYAVKVTPSIGFSGTVSFGVSGLPRNVTGTFSPSMVTTSGSSTLTINTQSGTPKGTSTLTITGTSGILKHSVPVSLIVN